MTYRDHEIIIEIPGFGQYELDDAGKSRRFIEFVEDEGKQWYVVRKDGAYIEALSSVDEAKQFIDFLHGAKDGEEFEFQLRV